MSLSAAQDLPHRDRHGQRDPLTVAVPVGDRAAGVRADALPVTGEHPPLFAVLGAHGGAGASTLAAWWAPAADSGRTWPASPETTQLVVIVARLCLPGLVACLDRLHEWHAEVTPEGVQVLGVVLIPARPGRVPRSVRRYCANVTEMAPVVWEIGWHDGLLETEPEHLASSRPFDPPPPRRADLHSAVPPDVHRVGAAVIDRVRHLHHSRSASPAPEVR